jgi:IMP dehydrogenase
MCDRIKELVLFRKTKNLSFQIIAGNVCTAMGYMDLANAGADAVKVGVGCGAICITRMKTGFGVPQFSAIQECAEAAKRLRVPIIADGGIRDSRDMILALAAGANSIMTGSLFSKTEDSCGEKYWRDKDCSCKNCKNEKFNECSEMQFFNSGGEPKNTQMYVKYRGQASKDFQDDFYGKMKTGTVAEGVAFYAKVTGSAQDVIDDLSGSLRSALTYGGSRNIKELQRKAEFRRVTATYMPESKPRPNQ